MVLLGNMVSLQLVKQFFFRAPDGSCILTCSNDNKMRLFNLPAELCSPNKPNAQELPELVGPAL